MNPILTEKLLHRFPTLYRNYYKPMSESCMCWGFECGDGWFNILWMLSLAIEDELKQNPMPEFAVDQVKEKFGGLRYYCPFTEKTFDFIVLAERLASHTCEVCGVVGEPRNQHRWLSTLCHGCHQNKEKTQ